MKVGLTFDLKEDYLAKGFSEEDVAEFDRIRAIEGIESVLKDLGFEIERIGDFQSLVRSLFNGKSWDIVFNICEGIYGRSREALVPNILDAYQIPYVFSDASALTICLNKAVTKRIIKDMGIATAPFTVIEDLIDLQNISLSYPLFAKPNFGGSGKGINHLSKISNKDELLKICNILLNRYKQPVLIEEFLSGREYSVGIIGTGKEAKVIGVLEMNCQGPVKDRIYSYEIKQKEDFFAYKMPKKQIYEECEDLALRVWTGLGCRDSGRMDLRYDRNGILNFIEVNPLAGITEGYSDLVIIAENYGITYKELIKKIMDSAIERTWSL